ncbi:MAG: hypothetical protein AAGE85_15705 [Pseudomonadota bacterium]
MRTRRAAVADSVGRLLLKQVTHMALDPDGRDALLWIDGSKPEGVNVLRKEPETSWWDRVSMRLMSWLPIESQL